MSRFRRLTSCELWVNRTLEHMSAAATYGCSGLLGIHWRTTQTAPQISAMAQKAWDPPLTSGEFWADWAASNFGASVGGAAAAVFLTIDSFLTPRPVDWVNGPGFWVAAHGECDYGNKYDFVDTFAALRPAVTGAANLARFDFWLHSLAYMRGIAVVDCGMAEYTDIIAAVEATTPRAAQQAMAEKVDAPARAVTARIRSGVPNPPPAAAPPPRAGRAARAHRARRKHHARDEPPPRAPHVARRAGHRLQRARALDAEFPDAARGGARGAVGLRAARGGASTDDVQRCAPAVAIVCCVRACVCRGPPV
jgi:hypothetical protein